MSKITEITLTDNSGKILSAFKEQSIKALEEMGIFAENTAKANITDQKAVNTGNLRNSITYKVEQTEPAMYVGTNVEYAVYVEMGTGKYVAGGRPTPWMYVDDKGWYHWTAGMKARPYLKPAIDNHRSTYQEILKNHLKG